MAELARQSETVQAGDLLQYGRGDRGVADIIEKGAGAFHGWHINKLMPSAWQRGIMPAELIRQFGNELVELEISDRRLQIIEDQTQSLQQPRLGHHRATNKRQRPSPVIQRLANEAGLCKVQTAAKS